jgi:hypothetical protein
MTSAFKGLFIGLRLGGATMRIPTGKDYPAALAAGQGKH